MTINMITKEQDIVCSVQLIASPTEYLIISAALKQFAENTNNNLVDIDVAKRMREVIEDGTDD